MLITQLGSEFTVFQAPDHTAWVGIPNPNPATCQLYGGCLNLCEPQSTRL